MLKNYKELNVGLYGKREASGIKRGDRGYRKDAESADQIPGKQTLESWNPWPLGPFLTTYWTLACGVVARRAKPQPLGPVTLIALNLGILC